MSSSRKKSCRNPVDSSLQRADNPVSAGEEMATLLLNSTAEGIVSLDVEGVCTFCNSASLKLLGYEDERELLGKSLHELVHHTRVDGTPLNPTDCKVCRAFHEGIPIHARDEILWRKDGTGFSVEYHAHPIRKKGELIGAVVTFLDITERKRMETALSDSEKRYHTLTEVSPVGIFHADAKGMFHYVNERWCEITGFTRKEALHKGLASGLHPEDRERVLEAWCEDAGKDLPFRCEYRLQRPDGVSSWVYSQIVAEKSDSGEVVGYVGTITDINERKLVEEELRERNEFIETVTDNLPIGFSVSSWDDGTILYSNRIIAEIAGWPTEIITDRNAYFDHAIADPKRREELKAKLKGRYHASGDPSTMTFELQVTKQSGEEAELLVLEIPMPERKLLISTVQDITASKRAAEEIRLLNQTLEARVIERTRELELANQELEAFTYSVSHDLRAPLRAIDGFSEALLEEYEDKLDDEGKTFLRYLQEGSHEMSDLIDGLLSLSRSVRGELTVEQVSLSALAGEVIADLRKAEPERRVTVHAAAGVEVTADPRLLKVVMENLLGNAWKYTSRSSDARVEFGVEEKERETVYFVRDNGAGFEMAYADKLFLPFHRLHKTEEFPGIGIGLATVQRIIHRHCGRIWAESTVGEGATFHFTLGGGGIDHEK